jgi:hypothetical protein
MIAFALGTNSVSPVAEAALTKKLDQFRHKYPEGTFGPVKQWRSAHGSIVCAWIAHPSEALGGVSYTWSNSEAFTLFSGRPVVWSGEVADGRRSRRGNVLEGPRRMAAAP